MESYQKEISLIQQILKENPKGMTVTDISRKIKINRNSVAKYLDIMRISGLVEMVTFGPAKVFFPARRIPISTVLNFTSDYVVVLDKDLKIVLINDIFLEFIKIERGEIIGRTIDDAILPMLSEDIDISDIREALEGKDFTKEIIAQMNGEDIYLKVRVIPTTFEDGRNGVALIIRNITERKIAEKTLRESEEQFKMFLEKMNKAKK